VRVAVVDYDIGNLYGVQRALETAGGAVLLTADAAAIAAAERVVLPGVGAFADCMQGLRERGLVDVVRNYALGGKPLLGICVGMQMLADASEEFGQHEGLGVIPGTVRAVPASDVEGRPHNIPHIGWSALSRPAGRDWRGTPLENTEPDTFVYLVHSFALLPARESDRLADCHYGGHRICAAIGRGNVFGTQFHPEKSGPAGLAMLAAFLRRT
jgi:imidazole glycerol-phosphate synthase subunit HisH